MHDFGDLVNNIKESIKQIVNINMKSKDFDLELHNKFIEKGQLFNEKIKELYQQLDSYQQGKRI